MTYGVVSGKPMELPGSFLIGISYVEGFYEGLPHILPKIAPVLRKLVKMIEPRRHSPARASGTGEWRHTFEKDIRATRLQRPANSYHRRRSHTRTGFRQPGIGSPLE